MFSFRFPRSSHEMRKEKRRKEQGRMWLKEEGKKVEGRKRLNDPVKICVSDSRVPQWKVEGRKEESG